MLVPPHHPQLNNFSIEPMVLGYPHFRKTPYVYINVYGLMNCRIFIYMMPDKVSSVGGKK